MHDVVHHEHAHGVNRDGSEEAPARDFAAGGCLNDRGQRYQIDEDEK
jgi:hypothetical protein